MPAAHDYIKRHVTLNGKSTTIAMERLYWTAVDKIARQSNTTPEAVIATLLKAKPSDYSSRAGWLRFAVSAKLLILLQKTKPKQHP